MEFRLINGKVLKLIDLVCNDNNAPDANQLQELVLCTAKSVIRGGIKVSALQKHYQLLENRHQTPQQS